MIQEGPWVVLLGMGTFWLLPQFCCVFSKVIFPTFAKNLLKVSTLFLNVSSLLSSVSEALHLSLEITCLSIFHVAALFPLLLSSLLL